VRLRLIRSRWTLKILDLHRDHWIFAQQNSANCTESAERHWHAHGTYAHENRGIPVPSKGILDADEERVVAGELRSS
jgi:hypothetical protein